VDFSKQNLIPILKAAIPIRFQDFSPQDFEDFITQLFRDNGCEVDQTPYSGDYGADLILKIGGKKIAVQVKRYSAENKVGVPDLNQLIGAKTFYDCDTARIITTSCLSEQACQLAQKAGVFITDWDHLLRMISSTYFDGKDYYDFFQISESMSEEKEALQFRITSVFPFAEMEKGREMTLIVAEVTNVSGRNITVNFRLPTIVTKDRRQVESRLWITGYFDEGTLYADCSTEMSFGIDPNLLPTVQLGDRIVFKWIDDADSEESSVCLTLSPENCCPLPSLQEIEQEREIKELWDQASDAMDNEEWREAIRFYSQIIELNPEERLEHWFTMRGFAFKFLGDYAKAVSDFTTALQISPDNPKNHQLRYLRGDCYLELGDRRKATEDLRYFLEFGDPTPEEKEFAESMLKRCKSLFSF